ncbi:MAG: APC family permease, partial [Pseudonocardia sp.]
MSESRTSDDQVEPGFIRVLGRWDTLAVGFGAMIGFGWVVLVGGWLEEAGTLGAALAFAAGGLVMALVGLAYAELVSAMPRAGGEHNYALRALGSRPAFVTSWAIVLGYVSVVAFEAVALPQTVLYLAPNMQAGLLWSVAGSDVYLTWALVGIVGAVLVTTVNYIGIRPASVVQTIAVAFLIAVGLVLLTGAFVGGDSAHLE